MGLSIMRSTGSSSTSVYCLSTVKDCVLRVEIVRKSADTICFIFFMVGITERKTLDRVPFRLWTNKNVLGIANQV